MLKMVSKKYCHLRAQQTNPFGLTGRSHSTKAGAVQRWGRGADRHTQLRGFSRIIRGNDKSIRQNLVDNTDSREFRELQRTIAKADDDRAWAIKAICRFYTVPNLDRLPSPIRSAALSVLPPDRWCDPPTSALSARLGGGSLARQRNNWEQMLRANAADRHPVCRNAMLRVIWRGQRSASPQPA